MSRTSKQLWYDQYYPNQVPIGGFITIPGSGKEHAVEPGKKLVIAFTAINHSEVVDGDIAYDHAVDLSGADWEIYYGPDSKVDSHTTLSKQAVAATETTPAGEIDIHIMAIETSNIIDGVQTSDVPQDVKTRVVPETVDRGKFLVNGCHRQELCIRKEIKVGNKIYYQDTNNSSEDMQDVNERKAAGLTQNAFPIGWRNNQ